MRYLAILVLLSLTGLVCSQEPARIVDAFSKHICSGVSEGGSCKVPAPYDRELWGVCCNGKCTFRQDDCSGSRGQSSYDLYEVLQRYSCKEVEDGGDCDIPQGLNKVLGYELQGTCCTRLCRFGVSGCGSFCGDGFCTDQERMEGNCMEDCSGVTWDVCGDGICSGAERAGGKCYDDCGSDIVDGGGKPESIEEMTKEMEVLACLGVEDGEKCNLPADLEQEFGLSGVCCGGRCSYRQSSCESVEEPAEKPDLVIKSIEVNPPKPTGYDRVNVTVEVENVGEASVVRDFWVFLLIEDGRSGDTLTEVHYESREALEPGDTVAHTFTDNLGLGATGSFRVKAEVDRNANFEYLNDLIHESDEANNHAAKTLYVASEQKAPDSGSCGDGFCTEQERRSGDCMVDCGEIRLIDEGPDAMLVAAVLAVVLTAAAVLFLSRRRSSGVSVGEQESADELGRRKRELEEMMAIARAKYHRRELDEESFREIIRDNQMKVIELELKLKEMQD